MIEFNVIVPEKSKDEIFSIQSDTFTILSSTKTGWSRAYEWHWFLIKANEDEMTFLAMKYGLENVWKR